METDVFILLIVIVVAAIIAIWPFVGKFAYTAPPPASTASELLQRVKVQYVIDGDTVIVSKSWSEIRIRLDAIDCPEDGQHWGNIAKAGLIKLIEGRYVYIEAHGVDKYGRTLATIYLENYRGSEWVNVNERMVMLGHAWVMRKYYDHLPKSRQHQLNKLEKMGKIQASWSMENKQFYPALAVAKSRVIYATHPSQRERNVLLEAQPNKSLQRTRHKAPHR